MSHGGILVSKTIKDIKDSNWKQPIDLFTGE